MGFFSACPPADCSTAAIHALAAGSEPGDFIVPFGQSATTDTWPDFETEHTAICGASGDCSIDIVYKIERYACSSCTDEVACDRDLPGEICDMFAEVNVGSITAPNTLGS